MRDSMKSTSLNTALLVAILSALVTQANAAANDCIGFAPDGKAICIEPVVAKNQNQWTLGADENGWNYGLCDDTRGFTTYAQESRVCQFLGGTWNFNTGCPNQTTPLISTNWNAAADHLAYSLVGVPPWAPGVCSAAGQSGGQFGVSISYLISANPQ